MEDGRDNADSLAILLRTRGAEVRCAYSGAEGIDQSARWTPSLTLVDIGLPDMTGFEVVRRIALVAQHVETNPGAAER